MLVDRRHSLRRGFAASGERASSPGNPISCLNTRTIALHGSVSHWSLEFIDRDSGIRNLPANASIKDKQELIKLIPTATCLCPTTHRRTFPCHLDGRCRQTWSIAWTFRTLVGHGLEEEAEFGFLFSQSPRHPLAFLHIPSGAACGTIPGRPGRASPSCRTSVTPKNRLFATHWSIATLWIIVSGPSASTCASAISSDRFASGVPSSVPARAWEIGGKLVLRDYWLSTR